MLLAFLCFYQIFRILAIESSSNFKYFFGDRVKAKMKNYAIILASGVGARMGASLPKQFQRIAGKSILEHTIEVFEKAPQIDEIILVILWEYRFFIEEIILKNHYTKITKILNGGKTRKESSFIGINSIKDIEANVLIHDCVRPFLSQNIISKCLLHLAFKS